MRLVLASLILIPAILVTSDAAARRRARKDPMQHYEFRGDIDVAAATRANESVLDGQFSWFITPIRIDDPVVPELRRHVLRPSEIFLRIVHDGSTLETHTGAHAGGAGAFIGGLFWAKGSVGIETASIRYDRTEGDHTTAPLAGELAVRPTDSIAIGAYATYEPIVGSDFGGTMLSVLKTRRTGNEWEVGGKVEVSTPQDAFYLMLSAGYHKADWTFETRGPVWGGPITTAGLHASFELLFHSSSSLSWFIRGTGSRERWKNLRQNLAETGLMPPYERWVYAAHGDFGIVYWSNRRIGFRVGVGGGYETELPRVNGDARAAIRFALGLQWRF